MKKEELFVGIDISKATIDICLLKNDQSQLHQVKNTRNCIKLFINKLLKQNEGCKFFICMENTGYYNWPCYEAFQEKELELFVVNPLHLKKSMGLVRGKNDSLDAFRIAKFIQINNANLKPSIIPRKELRLIQALVAHRSRLIITKNKFDVPVNELAIVADKKMVSKIKKSSQKLIKEVGDQIKVIEKEIDNLIKGDDKLKVQFERLVSVQGVGKVLAWNMLIKTNEFKSINNPKKLACYAGVVPFDFKSGTSVYKKPRVSYMADKSLKKLLHLSAMRVIQIKGELQDYYLRKVGEGKNKMLVLNAIRNKIIGRICAVINNQRNFENRLHLS